MKLVSFWVLAMVIGTEFSVANGNFCQTMSQLCLQMDQVCPNKGQLQATPTSYLPPRVGKAGPKGQKGETGESSIVNYTAIGEKMEKSFQEMEKRIDEKIRNFETLMHGKFEEIEALRKLANVNCSSVSRKDAKIWNKNGGVFDVYPALNKYEVYCDLPSGSDSWTVIQRRQDGSENFNRNWADYVAGFGNKSQEFWLGLEPIYRLTYSGNYKLRIELSDWSGETRFADYESFSLGDANTKYRLSIGAYSGNAGDSLTYHDKMKFSTVDQDNDEWSSSCAATQGGGWWFNACDHSNLNGVYHVGGRYTGSENGVEWERWPHSGSYSMKETVMKLQLKV